MIHVILTSTMYKVGGIIPDDVTVTHTHKEFETIAQANSYLDNEHVVNPSHVTIIEGEKMKTHVNEITQIDYDQGE